MNAVDRRGTGLTRHARLIACLAMAVLATSCTVVKIKYLDAQALAAKGRRGKIVSVQSADASVVYNFSEDDPAIVKDGAILGNTHSLRTFDLFDVADLHRSAAPGGDGPVRLPAHRQLLRDAARSEGTEERVRGDRP